MRELTTTKATVLVLAAAALPLAAGCGEKEEPDLAQLPTSTTPAATTTTAPTTTTSGGGTTTGGGQTTTGGGGQGGGSAAGARERAVTKAVFAYVTALDRGEGGRVCSLLVPGALDSVDLPFRRGGCGPSLDRSIGYRDPRGLPVFGGVRLTGLRLTVKGDRARAIATVRTNFVDRDQPSVEDDVIYLVPDRDRWLIAKPSALLYRAVGIADVPPSVLAPPR